MSNLIPVKRPDRNGKLVTRYVKADAEAGQAKNIPAPVTPVMEFSGSEPVVSEEELLRGFSVVKSKGRFTPNIKQNLTYMATYVPEGFREVIEDFSTASDYKAALWGHMLDWPPKDKGNERFSQAMLIELHVMETIAELDPDSTHKKDSGQSSIRRGTQLMSAARLSLSAYRQPKTVRQRKAVIFALWAKRFTGSDDRINVGEEIDNINYISENFPAVMEHRHTIRNRGTIDRGVIELIINNSAPAISEGLL